MHCVWENYSHFVSEWQYFPKNQNSNRTFSFLIYVCLPILPSIISLSIFVICVKNLRNNPMHITQYIQTVHSISKFNCMAQHLLACIEIDVFFWAGKIVEQNICLTTSVTFQKNVCSSGWRRVLSPDRSFTH